MSLVSHSITFLKPQLHSVRFMCVCIFSVFHIECLAYGVFKYDLVFGVTVYTQFLVVSPSDLHGNLLIK